ncbi:MAG TPA: hypothetical protein VMM13_16720 [Euzebya sp.]|nr:hypothetical protein [Euzebya sp.]
MSPNTAEWLLEISGLTVACRDGSERDVVSQGQALAAQVRGAAGAVAFHSTCQPQGCGEDCPLASIDGGAAACRLARLLSPQPPPATDIGPKLAARRYRQALQAAATAVFHCRRHAHPAGECWFSDDATEHCGDVLAVAHRIGH